MDTTGCLNRERIADQTREASESSWLLLAG